jgi:hypothetical protein
MTKGVYYADYVVIADKQKIQILISCVDPLRVWVLSKGGNKSLLKVRRKSYNRP